MRDKLWTYESIKYNKLPLHNLLCNDGSYIDVIMFKNGCFFNIATLSRVSREFPYHIHEVPTFRGININDIPHVAMMKIARSEKEAREYLEEISKMHMSGVPDTKKLEDSTHFNNLLEKYSEEKTMLPTGKEIV